MINMIALEQNRYLDWQSGKFPMLWKKIKKRFSPDDDVVMMDMDDDLCKIKLHQYKDPKNLLDDIAVVKVQYGCVLSKEKWQQLLYVQEHLIMLRSSHS